MRTLRRALAGLCLGGLLSSFAACRERLCDPDLSPHASYSVSLLDVYKAGGAFTFSDGLGDSDSASTGSCAAFDGMQPGAMLTLAATGLQSDRSNTCEYVVAALTSAPPGVTVEGQSKDPTATLQAEGNGGLYAIDDVTVGACAGTMIIEIFEGGASGGLAATPVEGQFPPAVVYRLFLPSTGPCQPCDDNFAARVVETRSAAPSSSWRRTF